MRIKEISDQYGVPLLIVIAVFGSLIAYSHWMVPKDATDPPDGRSGMELLTDHGTGCQYLYRTGAITPRMDKDGRQICVAP